MSELGPLIHRLRNTPTRELIAALRKDGFTSERETRTGGRIVVIHYHHGSDTLTRQTLRSVLVATRWTEADAKRLALM